MKHPWLVIRKCLVSHFLLSSLSATSRKVISPQEPFLFRLLFPLLPSNFCSQSDEDQCGSLLHHFTTFTVFKIIDHISVILYFYSKT